MNEIERALKGSGYRLTQSRQAVARVLLESTDWLRPEAIHQLGRQHHPSLGLVTVYRTLALLTELGWVSKIHLEDGCHGYARSQMSHSHHLVCRQCQQAVEFPGQRDVAALIERLERRTGYVVEEHMLELLGLCPSCQPERANAGGG